MSDATVKVYQDEHHMWIDAETHLGQIVTYVESERSYYHSFRDAPHIPAARVSAMTWTAAGGDLCYADFGAYGLCIAPEGHGHEDHIDANMQRFTIPEPPAEPVVIEMVAAEPNTYGLAYRSAADHKIQGAKHNRGANFQINIWINVFRPNPHPVAVWKGVGMIGGPGKYLGADNKGTDQPYSVTTTAQASVISARPIFYGAVGEGLKLGQSVMLRLPSGVELGPFVVTDRAMSDPELVPVD